MLEKTRAVVLHSFRYGESKMIVDMLTPTFGRMSCIAAVSKGPHGKLKKQYFQPLSILETMIDMRPRTRLHTMKEARIDEPFASIPFDPLKLSTAMFTAEFLRAATRRELSDELTFAYTENSIRWLDGCKGNFANFHLVFMTRMTKFFGFYPNLDHYVPGCRFDLRTACFCTDMPLHTDCLPPAEAARMNVLLRMNYPTMHLFRMTREERNHTTDVILRYYEIHMPGFPELKSLPVLKELFV